MCVAAAQAVVTQATTDACDEMSRALPGRIAYPSSWAYYNENRNYWSQILIDMKPACIALPLSAPEVSTIVKILHNYKSPQVPFAIKSGGHSPNPGFAGVEDGVLISLANMKGAKYDERRELAYVGPGGKWRDVVEDLAPWRKTVVGGRLDVVGVGGYLTGGGLSFLSAQYGMAADSIVNFETVLANGTILNVNAQTNPDLLVAMRGGGNQYGIVTNFTMKAVPIGTNGKVWGGPIVFSDTNRNALLAAFHDFTEKPADPKAAIILTSAHLGGVGVWILHRFYDGEQPSQGAFKQFEAIDHIPGLDGGWARSYGDLLYANGYGADSMAYARMNFRMVTLPLLPGQEGVEHLKDATSAWLNETKSFQDNNRLAVESFALQSFPSLIGQATARGEGNAMGLTASDGPRWMIELASIHSDSGADNAIVETSRKVFDRLVTDLKVRLNSRKVSTSDVSAKVEDYNPLFMNDAAFDQDVYSSYRDFSKFRDLQRQMDPEGFWLRTGGFKFK